MDRIFSDDLWPIVRRIGKKATRKRAAVAYVTSEEYLAFGKGDELVTDASDAAICAGQTKASVLANAIRRGATVYSLDGLHAKLILLDDTAVIGSANLSSSSATSLIEAAWLGSSPALVGGVVTLLEQLKDRADRVDEEFLDRISKLEVSPRTNSKRRDTSLKKLLIQPPRTWLIGVHELARLFADEAEAVAKGETIAAERLQSKDSEVDWIRWTGKSRFRLEAVQGDAVITMWSEGKPRKIVRVYRHAPILLRQDDSRCTRFYVEDFADAEDHTLSFGGFKSLLKRVGVNARVGRYSGREISQDQSEALYRLWKD